MTEGPGKARFLLLLWVAAGLVAGIASHLAGAAQLAAIAWGAAALPVAASVAIATVRALSGGQLGVDVIALAAIIGALALGEHAAAAVIALMVAGGEALEAWAEGRATRSLADLLSRAPRVAARIGPDGVAEVAVAEIVPGDRILVRPGETVAVDGTLEDEAATLDESVLTGEAMPVVHASGASLRSGAVNAGPAFTLTATAGAEASTYAAIVRLTRAAAAERPPLARLADQWALGFLGLTALLAGGAWAVSGDPVRALAVLVVATPCPLILAAPIALMAGIGRAARRGIVVKGGGALERLARVRTVLFDKTGTLTPGRPRLATTETVASLGREEALRLAACLAQGSTHPVSQALVSAAASLAVPVPDQVEEHPGGGLTGRAEGRALALGSEGFLDSRGIGPSDGLGASAALAGAGSIAWLAVDGEAVAAFVMADGVRAEAPRAVRRLRAAGIGRLVMVTGDRRAAATPIAAALRLDAVLSDLSPEDKIAAVRAERAQAPVAMVGDGVNDAPALAAADVGVAMGAHGTAAAAEAADAVLLVDRLDRVAEAVAIAVRARRIALQAIALGMGLSGVAMVVAALGHLPPLAGALVQEAIDVAAILFALTALRPGRDDAAPSRVAEAAGLAERTGEHARLRALAAELRAAADSISRGADALPMIAAAEAALRAEVLPHQQAEEEMLYPAVARSLGGRDPLAALSRMHAEIETITGQLGALLAVARSHGGWERAAPELRRTLFTLDALLTLHLAAEEEVLAEVSGEAR
ncbi:MAG: heavy metal translocating P-type ATPase [Acetobacteraceae bacterium]|nr:heavy metal translocating P-type ATPase [Acetobacteraceae bacterium]